MIPARSSEGRGQGTAPSGRRAGGLRVTPFPSAARAFASLILAIFLGDSAFGLRRTQGREGMQHGAAETQSWLGGCRHSRGPTGTHGTSCKIGKFPNKISCTKS